MTWLTPMIGAIAAGIAIPSLVILYFLKLRRRDLEVSTTLLWKKSIEDLQANAPFQKLRKNLLLLLQLLILAAALLAIAQPQISGMQTSGGKHVILIDNSASSQTNDETNEGGSEVSRLERAKLKALALIENLQEAGVFRGTAEEAMVIAFSTGPEVLQHFTSDKRALRAAVEAIQTTDRPTRLAPAIKLIGEYAPIDILREPGEDGQINEYERPRKRVGTIHLYTDGGFPDAEDADFGPDDTLVYEDVGQPDTENIGITSLRASRDFKDPGKLSVFVGLHSNAQRVTTFDLELVVDGAIQEIKVVTMPAASRGPPIPDSTELPPLVPAAGGVIFTLDQPRGVVAAVRVRDSQGLAPDKFDVDDRAWLVIPPAKQLAVAIVSARGNLFIADALRGLPLAKLDFQTPDQYEKLIADGNAGEYDVVILDGYLPEPDDTEVIGLPPGRFLIFNNVPQSHTTMTTDGNAEGFGVMTDWDHNHPILRGLALSTLVFGNPFNVTLPENTTARVLAQCAVGTQNLPAILEVANAETRAIVVPFDVANSNWGLDPRWVIFLGQTVQYLGEADSTGVGQSIRPGQQIVDRIPAGATNVTVRTPDDQLESIEPAEDGSIIYGPIIETGIYTVSWQGAARAEDEQAGSRVSRAYAANLTDQVESNVGMLQTVRTSSGDLVSQADTGDEIETPKRLWPWLILAALAICIIEWYIYNRKVYV